MTLLLLLTALVVLALKWRHITHTLSRWQVALLCLLIAGVVLALAVPEARLMLPLMDAVGWDIFTISCRAPTEALRGDCLSLCHSSSTNCRRCDTACCLGGLLRIEKR